MAPPDMTLPTHYTSLGRVAHLAREAVRWGTPVFKTDPKSRLKPSSQPIVRKARLGSAVEFREKFCVAGGDAGWGTGPAVQP